MNLLLKGSRFGFGIIVGIDCCVLMEFYCFFCIMNFKGLLIMVFIERIGVKKKL